MATRPYRLRAGKRHFQDNRPLRAGSTVNLTDSQYQAWRDRFDPIHTSGSTSPSSRTAEAWKGIRNMKAPDAVKLIKTLDSLDQLAAAYEAERSDKNRSTVLNAIDVRMEQVQEGEDAEGEEEEEEDGEEEEEEDDEDYEEDEDEDEEEEDE